MNILTESEVIERLDGIKRKAFEVGLRPLMVKEGVAIRIGVGKRATWVYDGDALWRWVEYAEKRRALIQLGHWSTKRPYSNKDMHALVDQGVYDGEIDHPAFRVANNEE